ncbi:MAG: single-stranded DNA-binding protein [Patescibacteria group bacterium]|nr:single-stranded DNA-binding protein [Patescibacteria group bacterium]
MRTVNKVILIGNLTRDVELKETQGGQKIATFGIATNREWVTSDGEKHESVEFTECVAWSKLAEICEKFLKKGNLIYAEGYLKTRSWDLPDGTRKHRTEVVVEDMVMLEKRKDRVDGEEIELDDDVLPVKEEELPGDEDLAF